MSDPNHRARIKQIVDMYKAGQKSEARRLIAEVIKANPNDADAWYIAGQILDESPKKIKAFERALAVNPSHQAARTALDNLRDANSLLDTVRDDSDGLLDDDIGIPLASYAPPPASPSVSSKLDYADPKTLVWIIAGTLAVGIFLGALCLGTINSGRFLGVVFAPTVTPSKTPTVTPTFTPSRTPTPTLDIAATATALASTQQYFDSTSTAQAQFGAQAVAATQLAQQFLLTASAITVVNQQIEAAIAATQNANAQFFPTWTATPFTVDSLTPTRLPVESAYTNLAFSPIDVDYSPVMDRVIFVSANPNQLHIFNPNNAEDTIVELSRVPRAVSVGPDGLFAAVGHDAKISYVDLQNAAVRTTLDVVADVGEIALGGNGWIYVVPLRDQWENVRAINIASNTEVKGGTIYAGAEVRLHPDGNRIYTATRRLSPGDIARYDFVDSVPLEGRDSRYHGDYATCDDIWFSADGSRIFTPCGTVFRSSVNIDDDMIYAGTLDGLPPMAYMIHVPAVRRIMGISAADNSLGIWDDETYTLNSTFQLPDMVVNGQQLPVIGNALFVDPLATHYYAIVQAGENSSNFGLLVADVPR